MDGKLFFFLVKKKGSCPSSSGSQQVTGHFYATDGKTEAQQTPQLLWESLQQEQRLNLCFQLPAQPASCACFSHQPGQDTMTASHGPPPSAEEGIVIAHSYGGGEASSQRAPANLSFLLLSLQTLHPAGRETNEGNGPGPAVGVCSICSLKRERSHMGFSV